MLDVNLGEGTSFDLARTLRLRGIPFLFFTGYDRTALPPEFADVERLEKPVDAAHLLRAVEGCCRSAQPSGWDHPPGNSNGQNAQLRGHGAYW